MAIFSQDEKALTAAPGIGKKLAQRIILELKDKLGSQDMPQQTGALPESAPVVGSSLALAQAALAELGYSQPEIAAALKGVKPDGMTTEQLVREALRTMVMR